MTIGASLRGRVVIEAAATRPSGLAGIVSLAGERTIENYRDILPDARKVISPALYVGAKEDFAAQGSGSSGGYTMRCGESQTFCFSATASPTAWT